MENPPPLSPSHVLAGAAWAFSLVLLFDLLHVPLSTLGALGLIRGAGQLAFALGSWVALLAAPLAAVAIIAGLSAHRGRRHWMPGGVLGMTIAMSLVLYIELVGYERFKGYAPFILLHIGLSLLLGAGWGHAFTGAPQRVGAQLAAAAGVLLGCVVTVMNYSVFPEQYPTLHLTGIGAALLLFAMGIANVLRLVSDEMSVRLIAGSILCPILIGSLATTFGSTRSISSGSLIALANYAPSPGEPIQIPDYEGPCTAAPAKMGRGVAAEIFRTHSRMPALPDSFRLGDHNVLFILIDTVRYDETSFDTKGHDATPRLKEFADRGAFVFDRAYAASSTTFQAAGSLLAMSIPSLSPLFVDPARPWKGGLDDNPRSAIKAFSRAGYRTFARLHRGIGLCDGCERDFDDAKRGAPMMDPKHDAKLADDAIEQITAQAAKGGRFFGWLFFLSPHEPYLNRAGEASKQRSWYREEVKYADAQVGRVLDHLDRTGLLHSTVVIVGSDHGEAFGEHGTFHHSLNVFVESLHVPLVVHVPNVRGLHIGGPTSLNYVLPWLMRTEPGPLRDLAEAAIQEDVAPLMNVSEGAVIAEFLGVLPMQSTLIYERHKVNYHYRTGALEIYDIGADPAERTPLRDLDARAELERRMSAYRALRACRQRYRFSAQR